MTTQFADGPRYSRDAIIAAMTEAGLERPIAMICRARDNAVYYDLVAGLPAHRLRERVPIDGDEAAFTAAIDRLAQRLAE
jgi:hypothetical protein